MCKFSILRRILQDHIVALKISEACIEGGVSLDNGRDWFAQGAVAIGIGVGGSLTGPGKDGLINESTATLSQMRQLNLLMFWHFK